MKTKTNNVIIKQSIIPELVSGSSTQTVILGNPLKQQALKTLKKFQGLSNFITARGFTLVELLVVVLIIGILAAVAVPQYQVAVVKSKTKAILPVLSAIQRAQEVYYLNNGQYAENTEELDIQVPAECKNDIDVPVRWTCGKDFIVLTNTYGATVANYCPGHNDDMDNCKDYREFSIRWAFDNCSNGTERSCGREKYPPKERACRVHNDSIFGEKICKAFFNN